MTGSSVSGRGNGASRARTNHQLDMLTNAPYIIFAGTISVSEGVSSPPIDDDTVVFPYVLTGGHENYAVLLTTLNGGYVYVSEKNEDEDGNFVGFDMVAETDSDVMYLVVKNGTRPAV